MGRNCDLFPGTALQCKETFSLLFYEFDAAIHQPPPWEPEAYKLIDRIAADEGRFTNNNEVIINTDLSTPDQAGWPTNNSQGTSFSGNFKITENCSGAQSVF